MNSATRVTLSRQLIVSLCDLRLKWLLYTSF